MLVIVLLTISASVMYSSSESAYKLNTLFSVSIENFPLRNLEFDEQTSSYYVSGKNILYKFDTRSSIPTEKVVTGPNYGCATDTEMSKEFRSDDENSVMVVTTDYIVTCGTLFGGECLRREKKTLRNRNRLKVYLVNNNTVSALGKFITITLRGEKHLRKVLLFAKPFSKIYSSMFERKVIFSAYTELVGNLTTRNEIDTFDLILKEPGTNTNLNYRSMFENDDFVFILFNQNSGAKLAKLCKSIEGENSKLPYEEIPISCYDERKNFTTAVHGKFVMQSGTRYLAAVFSNSEETFALCLFSETELYNAFLSSRRQRFGCPSQDLPPSDMIYEDVLNLGQCINISSGYDDEPFPGAYDIVNKGDFCNNVTNLESHFRIIIGLLPLNGTAVYKTQMKIRIIGDQVENGFVLLYLGTDQGSIVKTYLDETLQVHYIERIRIDNSRIQAITNINGVPIVMTEYKIVNITSRGCENFSESCKDCMRAKSAQCGWCLSIQRCTERLACNNESNLWLSSLKNHCLKIHLNINSIEVDLHQRTNVTVTFIPSAEATRNMTCILNVTSLPSLQEKGKLKCLIDLSAMKIGGHSVEPGKKELKVSLDGNVIAVTDILFYRCEDIKSCWRCTGNKKIRCFWCLLDAMCSNTRVKCSNMHGVDELEDRNCNDVVQMEVCPMILNSTQRISSGSIHNISFQGRHLPSKLTYQCFIGDKIFKSSWDNITNSLICENIKISYTERMATKDFQVRFKSGPNEPTVWLNSFKNATRISAYKCEYLSPDLSDCSRCQFLKAFRGYNCVWCGKTNGCVESEKCLTQEICPPPEITKIDPRDGPVGGGTVVRIEGKNLGVSISDVQMVSVAGRKCSNIQFVDQSIRCTTGKVNDAIRGDVMVNVSGIWSVKTVQFAYKNPNITNISPASVIQSGGARIWITGQDINIGNRDYKVILFKSGWWRRTFVPRCAIDLNVSVNGSIICVPGKSHLRGKHHVLVVFDTKTAIYYGEYLEIFPDPIIYGTIPPARDLKSIKSGGLAFYVTWQGYIDVIQNIFTSLSESSLEGQNCSRNNSGLLKCEFPTMQEHILGHRKKRDITFRTIAIHMDGFKHVISREVIYVSDPIFYPLNDNQSYEYDPTSGNRVITIKGSNMNTVASLQDYSVYVGSMECSVLQLHKDSLTFLPPLKEPDTLLQEERPYIRVRVGNINTIVGYLQYRTSKPVTPNFSGIVYIVLASGAVFLFFATCGSVVLISFCRRKKQSIGRTSSNEQGIPLKNVQRFTGSGMLNRKVSGNVTRTFESNVNENIEFLLQNNGLLISNQSLEIKREIGKGNFGVVFEGTLANLDDNSHIKVAIKTLHQNNLNQIDVDNFLDEAIRMHEFNHPNVLTLIGICLSMDDTPWIVLPFMKHGDLLGFLRDDKNILTRQNLMEYGIDISKGMEYLSSQKIVHRDLAARNCMVDESFRIVVADFGLSRDIYEKNYYSSSNKKTKLPVKWMSPESLEKGIYSSKSDVWSFGVILWELVTRGSKPYPEVDCWDMLDYIKDGRRLQQPTECPDDLYTIMELCWNLDPDQRPTFSDLIISLRQIVSPSDGYTELNSDYEGLHHTDAENDNQFGYDELKKI